MITQSKIRSNLLHSDQIHSDQKLDDLANSIDSRTKEFANTISTAIDKGTILGYTEGEVLLVNIKELPPIRKDRSNWRNRSIGVEAMTRAMGRIFCKQEIIKVSIEVNEKGLIGFWRINY